MSHERGRFPWSSFWFYGMGREQQVFPKRRHPCIMFYKKWHHHRFFFLSKWAFSEYPMEEGKAQNIWENFPERTLKLKLWKRIDWNFARWVTSSNCETVSHFCAMGNKLSGPKKVFRFSRPYSSSVSCCDCVYKGWAPGDIWDGDIYNNHKDTGLLKRKNLKKTLVWV